jgi:G6PDH family F420-dependent oxidoreductase
MTEFGYFLSCEEHPARDLVAIARRAEEAGFRSAWISDHYHPWNDAQGESPFVWTVLGAIASATRELRLTTAVTCPTVRTHPAVIAQAAATAATLLPGRFALGVGTGEALNEHILGTVWPEADVRLEMLEEAVEVIRLLWKGGFQSHHGRHYTVENARIYSLPDEPPPILVSAFGPKAVETAARIADGFVSVQPDADGLRSYREQGGKGPAQGGLKVCWAQDEADARKTAYELWPNEALPGELAQVLPSPRHFEQASEAVTEDMVAEQVPCGPDPEPVVAAIEEFVDAGFDEVYVNQIGRDQEGFFSFWEREVRPRLS